MHFMADARSVWIKMIAVLIISNAMNFYFGDKSTFFFSATVLPFTRLRVSIRWHTIRHHSLRFAHMHNFRRHSLLTYTVYVYGPVNSHIYFISISNDITKCIVQLLCDAHNTLVTLRLATCNNTKKVLLHNRIFAYILRMSAKKSKPINSREPESI